MINCRDCSSHFSFSLWMNCFSVSRPSPGLGENPFLGVVGLCLGCPTKERRKDHSGDSLYMYRHDLYVFLWPLGLMPTKEKKVCSTHKELSVFKKKKPRAPWNMVFFRGQSSKLFISHVTSGSEPESLLQVEESCPKSVSLRTEVVGGRNHLASTRHLEEQRSASWCVMLDSLEWQWEKWALPGQDSPYFIVDVENS